MPTNANLRHIALITVLSACLSTNSTAADLNGENLVLTDLSPYIAFVDTSVVDGSDWIVDTSQDHFYIHAGAGGLGGVNFLDFNSVNSSIALGLGASASVDLSIALGYLASVTGNHATAIGYEASASGSQSIALGRLANAGAGSTTALGNSAFATGTSSIAIGTLAQSSGISSAAFGHSSNATAPYSVALGFGAKADGDSSTAIGTSSYASQANTVILGSMPGVNNGNAYANAGFGTHTPSEAVDVQRSAAAARFQLTSFTNDPVQAPQYIQRRARGTTAAPTAVQNNDNLGLFSFRGYNGSSMGGSRATITAQAAGNFTGASTPTRLIFATTPVGSTTPQQVLVITPDGKVQVNGQNLTVPDYVFEDDYELMPLHELKTFIEENGHLPGIPSADEVNAGTHDLAGSDMAHLRKIEELTLYTLQQQALIESLRDVVNGQQASISRLEELLAKP